MEIVIVVIAVLAFLAIGALVLRATAAGKRKAPGDRTGDQGDQPPGRTGRVRGSG